MTSQWFANPGPQDYCRIISKSFGYFSIIIILPDNSTFSPIYRYSIGTQYLKLSSKGRREVFYAEKYLIANILEMAMADFQKC